LTNDSGRPETPDAQTYLELANRLLEVSRNARTAEARQQMLLIAGLYRNLARSVQSRQLPPLPPLTLDGAGLHLAWQGNFLAFERAVVTENIPDAPGIYALWKPDYWIYVGECGDLRARLLAHLEGDDVHISSEAPTGCGFELLASESERAARRTQLVRELMPAYRPVSG